MDLGFVPLGGYPAGLLYSLEVVLISLRSLQAGGRKPARFSDEVMFDICPHIPRLGDPLPRVSALSDAQCFLVSTLPICLNFQDRDI